MLSLRSLLAVAISFALFHAAVAVSNLDSFDVREATVDGVHHALFTGITTCRAVVSGFLSRIEAFNPTINAIISLNPEALSLADGLRPRSSCRKRYGQAIDNYDAVPMNTTGGNLALAGNQPTADAPAVQAFKDAGAIVLGKANLHELALEGLSVSSLGGQTVNPYDQTRTPGGSSGGTGAALAASFAVLGTGTDTVNSLRSPASANGLVSVRPTWGLISRAGVIPVSYTQDVVGPMARNVKDLAVALTVMASVGYDEGDNATALSRTSSLSGGTTATNDYTDYSASLYDYTREQRHVVHDGLFEIRRVEIINITEPIYNATALAKLDVQTAEFREMLNTYLAGPSVQSDHSTGVPSSFDELYTSSGGGFLVIPSQYDYINTALVSSTSNASHATNKNLVVKLGAPSQSGRNGILAALTGSPVVTVPIGFSPASENGTAPIGVPIGMEILGQPFTEGKLLNIAAHITREYPVRKMPPFANQSVETTSYAEVPTIIPNNDNIPPEYHVGCLS
ncbi:amidase signature enzyme [Apiospora arundinis]